MEPIRTAFFDFANFKGTKEVHTPPQSNISRLGHETLSAQASSTSQTSTQPDPRIEEDLSRLKNLKKQLELALDGTFNKEELLVQIGECFQQLHWNQDSSDFIRNKHGYRNRSEKGANKLNTKGAKIDFERLAHLKDLVKETTLYNSQDDLLRISCLNLLARVNFILDGVSPFEEEIGFLWNLSAYYHDCRCVEKLLKLLGNIQIFDPSHLQDRSKRYALAYLFCQWGETAKELSDFIKPETDVNCAEKNVLRFMFGKAGKYRQIIKNKPFIVTDLKNPMLAQMLLALKNKSDLLKQLLQSLQEDLKACAPSDYGSFSASFLLRSNISVKEITLNISLGTTNWSKRFLALEKELEQLLESKKKREEELLALKSAVPKENSEAVKYLSNKKFKELNGLLEALAKNLDLTQITFENTKGKASGMLKQVTQLFHSANQAAFAQHLGVLVEDFSSYNLDHLSKLIKNFFTEYTPHSNENALLEKIKALNEQIIEKGKEKQRISQLLSERGEPIPSSQQKKKVKSQKVLQIDLFLKNINDELNFIESLTDQKMHILAKYMSLGFVGQFCRDIVKSQQANPLIGKYINVLLERCIQSTIHIRNKEIMHGSLEPDFAKVTEILRETILPAKLDFQALKRANSQETETMIALANAFIRLGFYQDAIDLLDKYSTMIASGAVSIAINPQSLLQNLPTELQSLTPMLQWGLEVLPQSSVLEIQQNAFRYNEQLILKVLKLDCLIHLQNFKQGLTSADAVIAHIREIKSMSFILPEPISDELNAIVLYCMLQKTYFLLNLNQPDASLLALKGLEALFIASPSWKEKFTPLLVRIYTDLAFHSYATPAIAQSYLERIKKLIDSCDDQLLINFNILFRKYELVKNKDQLQQAVADLTAFFNTNEALFKEKLGVGYLNYKMESGLAALNAAGSPIEKRRILSQLDEISGTVTDLVIKNKYFISKLLSLTSDRSAFTKCMTEFLRLNQNHFREDKFIINMLKLIKVFPKQIAQDSAQFMLKNCKELTENQKKELTGLLSNR